MQYGFILDQEKCIGCHACTTACKQENDVPVGGFRTWVKYSERGKYPQVRRHFTVLRCNQCTKPPCVDICPVGALTKRPDGIVDIDRDTCIGCRACMQACPYDALYLNEDLGAVEKCHFCAHRVERGFAPACVNVCPVGAIIPGDFDDPNSEVSVIRREQVTLARRVEQGTGPNVFYVGADEAALRPGAMGKSASFIWSERPPYRSEPWPRELPVEDGAREVLNAEHRIEWGWQVALYLLTKGIAAGAAMVAPLLSWLGVAERVPWWYTEAIALVFTCVTAFLLVEDLKKPLHFYKLFTRPNWRSWLVKGGVILTAFGALTATLLGLGIARHLGASVPAPIEALRWGNAVLGAMTAGYTAFLFWQCKGRDLWESRWLLPSLLVQAAILGIVTLAPWVVAGTSDRWLGALIALALAFGGICLLEGAGAHTDNARQAHGFLRESQTLRWGIVAGAVGLLGMAAAQVWGLPLGLMVGSAWLFLVGLYGYESAFVRAGQLPPLS